MEPAPGIPFGGYRIVRPLGRGGMGAVYEALDPSGRSVALKVLLEQATGNDSDRQRFVREAQAAAAIRHPNVTQVHASGEEGGRAFIVFELVAGGSLAGLL
jgi:serine/threonine-protein kinase